MVYDLVVLGGGPAGYLASERAAHAGLSVLLVEKRFVGGVCLNEGCIPSKALLYSAKLLEQARHAASYGVKVPEGDDCVSPIASLKWYPCWAARAIPALAPCNAVLSAEAAIPVRSASKPIVYVLLAAELVCPALFDFDDPLHAARVGQDGRRKLPAHPGVECVIA